MILFCFLFPLSHVHGKGVLNPSRYRFDEKNKIVERLETPKWLISCFAGRTKGSFHGSSSGILLVQFIKPLNVGNPVSLTFPFEKNNACLNIIPDENEVYDVSYKHYSTSLSSTKLIYTSYFESNELRLIYQGETYQASTIEGDCSYEIDGLGYRYQLHMGKEYLILTVKKPIELLGKERTSSMVLQPGSMLFFSIKCPRKKR